MNTANDVLGFLLAAIEDDRDNLAPERLYVRLTSAGGTISYLSDPRENQANSSPVYRYALESAGRTSAVTMLVEIAKRRKNAGTLYT